MPRVLEIPLHGTGVVRFAWLDCPGPALAHVVDKTYIGTLTDRVLRFAPGGPIQVLERTRLPPASATPVHVRFP